jgi:hypothetical protein
MLICFTDGYNHIAMRSQSEKTKHSNIYNLSVRKETG